MSESGSRASMHVPTAGRNGNPTAVATEVIQALRAAGRADLAKEVMPRVFSSGSYQAALESIKDYVDEPTAAILDHLIASGGRDIDEEEIEEDEEEEEDEDDE